MFTAHGLLSIYRLYAVTEDPNKWYLTTALMGLLMETSITIYKKRGEEWKWSVRFQDVRTVCCVIGPRDILTYIVWPSSKRLYSRETVLLSPQQSADIWI